MLCGLAAARQNRFAPAPLRGAPVTRAGTPKFCGYERYIYRDRQNRITAQIIVIPGTNVRMSVRANEEALGFDCMRQQVTQPKLSDTYRRRPGFFLADVLAQLKLDGQSAILLNGNNIGYWGNQFVIEDSVIRYKRRGPLFDYGQLHHHATGEHAFFLGDDTFKIESLSLIGTPRVEGGSLESVRVSGVDLPRFGLSGFPLIRKGNSVWREHGELAWDPGLLFDLGRLQADRFEDLRSIVRYLLESEQELARHPMTVVALDDEKQIVLLVVEQSKRSRGMTVAEAADLLLRRFTVRDAIVLGAAGDAQLATTSEGFLTRPLVAAHALPAAREIPRHMLSPELSSHTDGRPTLARPVPCYVSFELSNAPPQHHRLLELVPIGMA